MNVKTHYFKRTSTPSQKDVLGKGGAMRIGQVNKVYFVDDEDNRSNGKFVEYDVIIQDDKYGKVVYRCRQASSIFSTNDYDELILEANDFSFDEGELSEATPSQNMNGTKVLVLFLNAKITDPIIIGTINHPRVKENPSLMQYSPATSEDGIRHKKEFRGIQTEINKEGEYSLTYLGKRKSNGEFERADKHPSVIKITRSGAISIFDREKSKFFTDQESKTMGLSQKSGTIENNEGKFSSEDEGEEINSITLDKENKNIVYKSNGVTVTQDGNSDKLTISTEGGVTTDIDGSSGLIELDASGVKITIDKSGTIDLEASSKVSLKSPEVDVGDSAALSSTLFEKLQAEFNAHFHNVPGNIGPPTTTPPAVPLLSVVGSTSVKVND